MRKILLLCLFLLSFAASAQDMPEAISAANISRLQSVAQIDFAAIDAKFDTAMFWMNASASQIIWGTNRGDAIQVTNLHTLSIPPTEDEILINRLGFTFADAENLVFSLYQIDGISYINGTAIQLEGMPLDIWLGDQASLFVETIQDNGQAVFWEFAYTVNPLLVAAAPVDHYPIPFTAVDVVRIGRIPPPYTVTSSLEGIVKLWNLQTGETLYEVDNGTGLPSVFGAINNPPTHLVWRDNGNEALYLLNFVTGENRRIANLNGEYAQWYFLSPDASVILGIDLGFNQSIVAWDVATREKTILGEYRPCNRPQPDMARLSSDGTTLVIGCDTGLDIWRIIN